ncbi:PAC2 family protein [Jonesia quinghaiensis]|uniref:PAC2 family protein n=1 Tax=Jonesia quinghaiensis TaxID=262806 RepID=UPI001FE052DE|nr:PAC2 family protein [Jonesia quinghaiensis]
MNRDLYDFDFDVLEELRVRTETAATGPVLIVALRPLVDAGHVTEITAEHLIAGGDVRRFVTFDHDSLIDYHARRPTMTFEVNRWTEYRQPHISLDVVSDAEGTDYLLLHGVEPDRRWDGFTEVIRELVEEFNISLVVGVYGIPMGIPHTREHSAIMHATRDSLLTTQPRWVGTVEVPASIANLLEFQLGEQGRDAVGIAAHVPHYLLQSQYYPSALVAVSRLEDVTGLDLRVGELAHAAAEARAEVDRQVEQSPEVAEVVRGLENQYDAFMAARDSESLLVRETQLPSADELGAEFEDFLRQEWRKGHRGDSSH